MKKKTVKQLTNTELSGLMELTKSVQAVIEKHPQKEIFSIAMTRELYRYSNRLNMERERRGNTYTPLLIKK